MLYLFKRKKVKYGLLIALGIITLLLVAFRGTILDNKWQIISAIPGPIRRAGRVTLREVQDLPYLRYRFLDHDLPVYDLQIEPRGLNFLNENLPEPDGFLGDDGGKGKEPVRAKFVHNSESFAVNVRYRGFTKQHWLWPKKSWRVEFDKDDLFNGSKNLNLIIPLDRQYLVEQFNNYRAKKLGLTVPESRFVLVTINGKKPAVYWQVEHFDKTFVERAGLEADTHIYGEDLILQPIYRDIAYWRTYLKKSSHKGDDYGPLSKLIELINNTDDDKFRNEIFSIIDKDSFFAWNIHSLLAASEHIDWAQNVRLYWHPRENKFYFIPWDTGFDHGWIVGDTNVLHQSSNTLMNRVLSQHNFLLERNRRLWQYITESKNLEDDLKAYDELWEQTRIGFYQDRIRRFSNKYLDNQVKSRRDWLENQFIHLQRLFTDHTANSKLWQTQTGTKLEINFNGVAPVYLDSIELVFAKDTDPKQFSLSIANESICNGTTDSIDSTNQRVLVDCTKYILQPEFDYQNPSVEDVPKDAFIVVRPKLASYEFSVNSPGLDIAKIEKFKVVLKNVFTNETINGVREQIVDQTGF
jgi:hypothetical protein